MASGIDADIFDSNNNKVGYVKDHDRKASGIFEWDIRKCSAYREKTLISNIKFSRGRKRFNHITQSIQRTKRKLGIPFGTEDFRTASGLKVELDNLSGNLSISFTDDKQQTIKIKKGSRIIAIVYNIAAEFGDTDPTYYVLEYRGKSPDDEINAFIMTIAINTLKTIHF